MVKIGFTSKHDEKNAETKYSQSQWTKSRNDKSIDNL